jgi:hypothetical protein
MASHQYVFPYVKGPDGKPIVIYSNGLASISNAGHHRYELKNGGKKAVEVTITSLPSGKTKTHRLDKDAAIKLQLEEEFAYISNETVT